MNIFGLRDASYFCNTFSPLSGWAENAPREFLKHRIQSRTVLREGTSIFNEFKACSLRDVERCLFLASSHYRRCLDLMIPSAAPWAHVTAYYGSYFAARAILGLFGVSVFKKKVIDAERRTPGNQALRVRSFGSGSGRQYTPHGGSHQRFWEVFYLSVPVLRTQVPPSIAFGLSPVFSNPLWQIEERNRVNYITVDSIKSAVDFEQSFSSGSFPASLPGSLVTQYKVFEALLEVAFSFSLRFSLDTDALDEFSSGTDLKERVRTYVYHSYSPSLVRKSKKSIFT